MTENGFNRFLSSYLIIINILVLCLVFYCYAQGWFLFTQMTTLVAIIFPMFSCYAMPAIRHIITDNVVIDNQSSKTVTLVRLLISILFPLLFGISIGGAILAQVKGYVFSNFEEFKVTLAVLESIFSAYISQIVYKTFSTGNAMSGPHG
jgi:hypothetical protein